MKRNVLENHHLFQANRNKRFVSELDFPAFDKKDDAIKVFDFINKVRKSPVNNSYEAFELSRDIEVHLRKQWSGMFFDFLKDREISIRLKSTDDAVSELQRTNEKLEELVKHIYRAVDKENADREILFISHFSNGEKFLKETLGRFNMFFSKGSSELKEAIDLKPLNLKWYEFLMKINAVQEVLHSNPDDDFPIILVRLEEDASLITKEVAITFSKSEINLLSEYFDNGYALLNKSDRAIIMENHTFPF